MLGNKRRNMKTSIFAEASYKWCCSLKTIQLGTGYIYTNTQCRKHDQEAIMCARVDGVLE